ncbi:MAG: AMP-binding protein, partial [Acidobacteria bacterium]|nr:AMP-binding protein [Acidobacteriota bacterium]
MSSAANLTDVLRVRAGRQADRPAYFFLSDTESCPASLSYAELDTRARAVASWLEREAAPGERVLLLYGAGPDFISAFFGCLYAGMIAAPVALPRPRAGYERLQAIQADTGARIALTTTALLPNFEVRLPGLHFQATDCIETALADEWREQRPADDDLAYLQYTSGSTGIPRGVMVSHANVLHNLANIDDGFRHTPESVSVNWLPHFHDMGLIYGLLEPLYIGFPCYVMSPVSFIQRPLRWLEAISHYKATHSGGPNFAYDLCVRTTSPEQRAGLDLSKWSVAFNGAEPIRADTLERFAATFEPCGFQRNAFYPAYGLAEASLKVSGGCRGEGPVFRTVNSRVMVGCGRVGRDTELAIVDPETLARCAPGQEGEIWVSGPGIATGYWRRPEETEQTFHAVPAGGAERPFLRTGDLGFVENGQLFIAGRLKDLIIIRGQNHHPGDIEAAVERSHPMLRASAAFSVENSGDERLVLLLEAERGTSPDIDDVARTVRQAVAEQFELQVYAVILVKRGGIPRTSSGKVQRRLCRTLYLKNELDIAAASVLEDAGPASPASGIPGLVAQVLKIRPETLDPQRPLTAYGLDSLMAMELKNRIEVEFGVTVPALDFLKGVTLAELTIRMQDAAAPVALARGAEPVLSLEQERLWLLDQLFPGNPAYHVPFAFRIKGPLDLTALERAVYQVARRHETLRTTFPLVNGKPAPVIADTLEFDLSVRDIGELESAARQPFDLSRGPLFRFEVFRAAREEHVALLTMHHIISDVWSVQLFLEELFALYSGYVLPPLPARYSDYASWQRQHTGDVAFWRDHMAGAPLLKLPTDHPRPAAAVFSAATFAFALPDSLPGRLRELGRTEGATLFMVLLAGFLTLLQRVSGQSDIVIGSTSANRTRLEWEKLIGFFASPLPLRADLSGDPDFREILARVRREVLEAYEHQDAPFAKIVEAAHPGRHAADTPLFQVMFSLLKPPLEGLRLPGLEVAPAEVDSGATDFELAVNMMAGADGIRGLVTYRSDLYEPQTIQALANSYIQVLETCARAPETALTRFAVRTEQPAIAITAI